MNACVRGDLSTVEYLLLLKADVNKVSMMFYMKRAKRETFQGVFDLTGTR